MPHSIFQIFDVPAFAEYIRRSTFQRSVTTIQNHHTWKPGYSNFNPAGGGNHLAMLESMRNTHIHERGWADIGQNITTFPDGAIGLCRPIDITPAGIFGANTGGICIEHIGNFDIGGDHMRPEHRDCIVMLNAILCRKFGLQPKPSQVVYHHWFDTKGRRFADAEVDSGRVQQQRLQKSCPGTAFFKGAEPQGNTVRSAMANFYPLISAALTNMGAPAIAGNTAASRRRVTVNSLNVRRGPAITFGRARMLGLGVEVDVFEVRGGWCRISPTAEEWVSEQFLA